MELHTGGKNLVTAAVNNDVSVGYRVDQRDYADMNRMGKKQQFTGQVYTGNDAGP